MELIHEPPPGPPPRRGLLDSLGYYYRFFVDPIAFVGGRFDQYGDIYYAPSKGVGLYVLRHPDHLWQVLVKDGAKYGKTHTAFALLERVLGRGLLTTDGDVWRRQRRMLQPAFSAKRLAGYAEAMVEEGERATRGWYDGQVRDISREMMELTLRVVSRTLFSHDVSGQTDTVADAMDMLRRSIGASEVLPSWVPSPARTRLEGSVDALDAIIERMIRERRGASQTPEPPDLLQMLLEAVDEEGDGGRMGDREIRDQLVTLFLAGHETTSHALSWTWYLLARHPEAEAKLHQELDRVLGSRPPVHGDLDALPYTAQVFDEAMRLYPPAYTLARRAEEDTTIGAYAVPKGSEVIIWTYFTHRDARWYPEPEVFRPERFAPEAAAARPKVAYLPFGAGARACIGKTFALVEGRLLLATLAQRLRFELCEEREVRVEPRVTLAPRGGIRMVVRRR